MNRISFCLALSLSACVGCGGAKSDLTFVPVTGVVHLDGQPLVDAEIAAVPVGATPGMGGGSRSNSNGEFQFSHARGERGLPEGEYIITVGLRKRPDGTVPPADDPTPPIDSNAVETLAPRYSDFSRSTLKLAVYSSATDPVELKLESSKPR